MHVLVAAEVPVEGQEGVPVEGQDGDNMTGLE